MEREYVIHGAPISLFTRKLEAAFDFYGASYRSERKGTRGGGDLEARAGTHQIPVLTTPENWALADTTPIIELRRWLKKNAMTRRPRLSSSGAASLPRNLRAPDTERM